MVEDLPDAATTKKALIRGGMWADAKERHDAGRIKAVEVRGSDYVGPRVSTATGHIARVAPAALQGKTVRVFGSPDQPHSFTDVRDMARALVRVAGEPSAWGRVWHAPTNPAKTQTEVLHDVAASVGRTHRQGEADAARAAVGRGSGGAPAARAAGDRVPVRRAVRPRLLGHRGGFGLAPTPWDEVCRATAENALLALA